MNNDRIVRILSLIGKLWQTAPSMRLLQLLYPAYKDGADPFNVSDEDLEKQLLKTYKILKEVK